VGTLFTAFLELVDPFLVRKNIFGISPLETFEIAETKKF
jgi:hypothetical protein